MQNLRILIYSFIYLPNSCIFFDQLISSNQIAKFNIGNYKNCIIVSGMLLLDMGRFEEAEELLRENLEARNDLPDSELEVHLQTETINAAGNLGKLLIMKGEISDRNEGKELLTGVLHLLSAAHGFPDTHPWIVKFQAALKLAEAAEAAERAEKEREVEEEKRRHEARRMELDRQRLIQIKREEEEEQRRAQAYEKAEAEAREKSKAEAEAEPVSAFQNLGSKQSGDSDYYGGDTVAGHLTSGTIPVVVDTDTTNPLLRGHSLSHFEDNSATNEGTDTADSDPPSKQPWLTSLLSIFGGLLPAKDEAAIVSDAVSTSASASVSVPILTDVSISLIGTDLEADSTNSAIKYTLISTDLRIYISISYLLNNYSFPVICPD